MANKAQKSLATRNAARLLQTHLITLSVHIIYHLRRLLLSTRLSLYPYLFLNAFPLAIELYLERIGRPSHDEHGQVRSSGTDLGARGVTDWLWDIVYWNWITNGIVICFGDGGWWAWIAIPLYSGWLAWTTFGGMRQGLSGLAGGASDGSGGGESKRQKKMEKRGGQRMAYKH